MPAQPRNLIGYIESEEAGGFFFLTPIEQHRYVAGLRLRNGVYTMCYFIPERLRQISVQEYITATAKDLAKLKSTDQRGVPARYAALSLMQTVWKEILRSTEVKCLEDEKRIAGILEASPVLAGFLIAKCGNGSIPGFPQTYAGYVRSVYALLHWTELWHGRKQGASSSMFWAAAAKMLTERLERVIPQWSADWELPGYTAASLKGIVDRYGQEFKLPPR